FIAAVFRLGGSFPFLFPPAIRRHGSIALANNSTAVAFRDGPVYFGVSRNDESSVIRIAHQSFDFHGLAWPIQIAVSNDFHLRWSSRPGIITSRWIGCTIDKLQR